MKLKPLVIFWTDALIAILFVLLATTGSIMKWVLPPGSGGGGGMGRGWRGGRGAGVHQVSSFWDMTRHEWGDVHFWIAVALIGGIVLHLLLHWNWLKVNLWRYLVPPMPWRRQGAAAGT
jgi:hypothetical protein